MTLRNPPRLVAGLVALAAIAAFAISCGDAGDGPKPSAPPSELAELAAKAETWATRAEVIVQRPWAARVEFPKRLHLRLQALRSFVQEAAAASAAGGAPDPRILERGRALITKAGPFDAALSTAERLATQLDQITGHQRMIELHMQPLETGGEAPFRIRVSNLNQQAAMALEYLDRALAGILDQAPDATLHENIAVGQLRQVLETATKLSAEVKKSSALASASVDRTRLLGNRVAWADEIASKAGDAVPADARAALEEARSFAAGPLPEKNAVVLDKLRNAQPDAAALAEDLARETDAVIERLTRSFLDLGRKSGVGDPR